MPAKRVSCTRGLTLLAPACACDTYLHPVNATIRHQEEAPEEADNTHCEDDRGGSQVSSAAGQMMYDTHIDTCIRGYRTRTLYSGAHLSGRLILFCIAASIPIGRACSRRGCT